MVNVSCVVCLGYLRNSMCSMHIGFGLNAHYQQLFFHGRMDEVSVSFFRNGVVVMFKAKMY